MNEFVVRTVDEGRDMIVWMAKQRRTTVHALIQAANMRSATLMNFVSPAGSSKRTQDTSISLVLTLAAGNDHQVLVRPEGGKHIQVHMPGAMPLEIRAAGGGLLEIPLFNMASVRTLGTTLVLATGDSLSALADRAGVSQSFTSFVNGTTDAKDVRLSLILKVINQAGFELVVQQKYASVREARLAALMSRR